MKYVSTRGQVDSVEFTDAVLMGLADDGGLIVPERIPDLSGRLDELRELSYSDLALEIVSAYATDISREDLAALIGKSYGEVFDPAVAPVVRVGDAFILELWHGPTMSFKDVALQLLGNLFEHILSSRGGALNILGATSGDTGSAAICGVRGRKGINIFIMHPQGRISPIQQRQMTTVLDANVHNIAIEGSFDDCQQIMKSLAGDLDFKRAYSLGAVNSVNWARVLAQMVYYFHAAFRVRELTGAEKVRVCVPTGNFGNILAGWYAMRMGAPIERLILATNSNDILSRFFNTGRYSLGEVCQTLAPAMDIQVASNFERYLYYKVGCDPDRLRELMAGFAETGGLEVEVAPGQAVDDAFEAGAADTDELLEAIRACYQEHGYLLDPHTACGLSVAHSLVPAHVGSGRGQSDEGSPLVCIATAHPAKFPEAIKQATGSDLAHHPTIDELMGLPTLCETLPKDQEAVRRFIIETMSQ